MEQRRRRELEDTAPVGGDTLLHTDLNEDNVIVASGGRAYVVDWALASRGVAWAEPALVVPWLIRAGHSPRAAEEWVARFPSWAEVDPDYLTRWAMTHAEVWRKRSETAPAGWVALYAGLFQHWGRPPVDGTAPVTERPGDRPSTDHRASAAGFSATENATLRGFSFDEAGSTRPTRLPAAQVV